MSKTTVIADALRLPAAQREDVAIRLLESLADDDYAEPPVSEPEAWNMAWAAEIKERLAELDAGTADVVPAAEGLARLRDGLATEASQIPTGCS